MPKPKIQAVKGTRDFYPEEMAFRIWLYDRIREVSASFGYEEWEGPLIEPFALYEAKSGEDLVKENYVFPDRSGELISLRPELTPTLARMVANKQKQLVYPLRWWSFGPFWRYERPQKGRTREFFQWNIDLIGTDNVIADAELIAIGATFFQKVGLTPSQVQILVNNRILMEQELRKLLISPENFVNAFRLIDRRDKLPYSEWVNYATEIGVTESQLIGIENLITNEELWQNSPVLKGLFTSLDALGVARWVKYDPKIIRGLDYYTGTVFEAWDSDGEFRAILGGGRYDNLVQDVGGDPVNAVGFAMGDVIMSLVLKKFGCVPASIRSNPSQLLITVFNDDLLTESLSLASEFRNAGFNVLAYPEPGKLSKQFKFADRMGIGIAIVLGPDEITKNELTIKNLVTGEQKVLSKPMAFNEIREMVSN